MATLTRMAKVVDAQNAQDPVYRRMCDDLAGNVAFQAACELTFEALRRPFRARNCQGLSRAPTLRQCCRLITMVQRKE